MKHFILGLGFLTILAGTPAAMAQPPAPPTPAAAQDHHEQIRAAMQQIDLKPKQKLEIARILKQAKASGQDKKTTIQQVGAVLEPAQKAKLMELLKEKGASK